MGSDGAAFGVRPERALHTIFGGEQPTEDELESVSQMRDNIMASSIEDIGSYDDACYAYAKVILEAFMANPNLAQLGTDELYDALKELHDEGTTERRLMSDLTGFMVGWATNAARRCVELEPNPNPAIVTIGTEDDGNDNTDQSEVST